MMARIALLFVACLTLTATAAGEGEAPVLYRRGHVVAHAAVAGDAESVRVAAGDDALWVLSRTLDRYPIRVKDGVRSIVWRDRSTIALPPSLRAIAAEGPVIVAPAAAAVWIIQPDRQQVWRFAGGEWVGPSSLPDAVFSAAGLPDGGLVINTPAHPVHAFAMLDAAGAVTMRFGSRRAAPVSAVNRAANSWIVTSAGRVVAAAHAYLPLLRIHDARGKVSRELEIGGPDAEAARHAFDRLLETLRVDAETCCIETRLVRAATAAAMTNDGIAVRIGRGATIRWIDPAGEGRRDLVLDIREPARALRGGFAVAGALIVGAETEEIVAFEPVSGVRATHGIVVDAAGEPIGGARVAVTTADGIRFAFSTDDAGAFALPPLDASRVVDLEARAPEFLPLRDRGRIADVAMRIVLERAPAQCFVVVEAGSERPVSRYELAVSVRRETHDRVTVEDGPRIAVAADDGRTCVTAALPLPWTVSVSAAGFARHEIAVAGREDVRIALEPAVPLTVVVRSDDQPLGGATVTIEKLLGEERLAYAIDPAQTAVTGADGVVELEGVAEGRYRLTVEHAEHLRVQELIDVEPPRRTKEIALSRGASVEVVVVAGVAGRGVRHANVQVDPLGHRVSKMLQCSTDDEGRCTIAALPVGRFVAHASAEGQTPARRSFEIGPGRKSIELRLELGSGVRVTGTVSGIEQYGGGRYDVVIGHPGTPLITAPVSDSGSFAASDVPAGVASVWVFDEKRNAMLYESREIPATAGHQLRLTLPPPIRVSGTIRSHGRPCGSCRLRFSRVGPETGRAGAEARVDGAGSYLALLAAPGAYRVDAEDPQKGMRVSEVVSIREQTVRDVTLGAAELEIHVRNARGEPVSNAAIQVHLRDLHELAGEAQSDAGGVARLTVAADTDLTVSARTPEGAGSVAVPRASRVVTVTIEGTAFSVRIVDAQTQLTLPAVSARLVSASGATSFVPRIVPDAAGTFLIPRLDGSPHTVVLGARGYATRTVHRLFDAPDAIALTPGGRSVQLRVVGSDAPCALELLDSRGAPVALGAELLPGRVPFFSRDAMLNLIEPGHYTLVLSYCDERTEAKPVALFPGSVPTVTFGGR